MNTHDVRAELFHLTKVLLNLRPLGIPVIFQQPPAFVVIVVEAPRDKLRSGFREDKTVARCRKSNTFKEDPANSLNNPKAEIYQTGSQSLSLKLYFDTYESGDKLTDITEKLWKFMEPGEEKGSKTKNYPPEVAFKWGPFSFEAYVTDMTQKFTLFKSDGDNVVKYWLPNSGR